MLTRPDACAENLLRFEEVSGEEEFARIRLTSRNQCPLLTEARLCCIQAELGKNFLSYTCAMYPRIVHRIGTVEETALALSCPEAARQVLLNPDLLQTATNGPNAESMAEPTGSIYELESRDQARNLQLHF